MSAGGIVFQDSQSFVGIWGAIPPREICMREMRNPVSIRYHSYMATGPSMQQMKSQILQGILCQIHFAFHHSPNINHVTAGYANC